MQGPHQQRPGAAAAACARAEHVLHAITDAVKDAQVVIAAADIPQLLHHHLQGAQWLSGSSIRCTGAWSRDPMAAIAMRRCTNR